METIVERLANDDEFLAPLLQTSYFSWQQKYLEVLVKLGNILVPRQKPWQTRDIILLVRDKLPKVYLVTALIKHSNDPGHNRYLLNEAELFQIGKLMSAPEKDFVNDLLFAVNPMSAEIRERACTFIHLLEPDRFSLVSNSDRWQHLFISPINLHQGDTVLESVGMNVEIDPKPLGPIFKSIYEYFTKHVKISTSLNYIDRSLLSTDQSTVKVEEIFTEPLMIEE